MMPLHFSTTLGSTAVHRVCCVFTCSIRLLLARSNTTTDFHRPATRVRTREIGVCLVAVARTPWHLARCLRRPLLL
uniref:Putative secreted protein n=1 Tax=Anopheles marajoara TaxID=58244 RepID=A0A2M4CCW2_9DIPT